MKTKLLFTFLSFCLFQFLYAQEVNYELSVSSQDYEKLENPTLLTEGIWDDPTFEVPIGFEFVFDSTTYTRIAMDDNTTGGLFYFDTDSLQTEIDIIMAYFSDVIDPGFLDTKSLGYIASSTIGEPGSRIFKMEWNNVGFCNEIENQGTASNIVNLQLWLYEGSNDIEWHFGPQTIKDQAVHDLGTPFIGLIYDLDTTQEDTFRTLVSIAGDPADPDLDVITNFSSFPRTLDIDPQNGTVYRLSSLFVSNENIPKITSNIDIYPTLTTDVLNIQVDFQNNEDLNLKILDLMGRDWSSTSMLREFQTLNISHLPAGQYFVNVQSDKAIWTKKIIKQ